MNKFEINQPSQYGKLSNEQQNFLQQWISSCVEPYRIKTYNGLTSYSIKHEFEKVPGGFYITNGMMKGAMQAAGIAPKDEGVKNWEYALSVKFFRHAESTANEYSNAL